MSTTYHTAIATGAAANASTFNTPMGQLDAAIESVNGVLDTMVDNGPESVSSAATLDLSGFNYQYIYLVSGNTNISEITPMTLPATSDPGDLPVHIYLVKMIGTWALVTGGNIAAGYIPAIGETAHLIYLPSAGYWVTV